MVPVPAMAVPVIMVVIVVVFMWMCHGLQLSGCGTEKKCIAIQAE
jgi:hypothetical protein